MIAAYLSVVSEIPFSRCRPILDRLLDGEDLAQIVSSGILSGRDRGLFRTLSGVADGSAEEIGTNLMLLYTAIHREAPPELVWTGPALRMSQVRDTFSVAREIIAGATDELIIAGYVVHYRVLETLGIGSALSRARVILVLDEVDWDDGGIRLLTRRGAEVICGRRGNSKMAKFHAKVIVADETTALVGSANFTYLGQRENVELGVRLSGASAAEVHVALRSLVESIRLSERGIS